MRRLLIVAGLALAAFTIALAANAHLGGSGSCGISSSIANYNNAATWGCGAGGTDGPNTVYWYTDDKQHDHSCVSMKYKDAGGTWATIGGSASCGPVDTGSVNVGEAVHGLRITINSQYLGNRYATICSSASDCANP